MAIRGRKPKPDDQKVNRNEVIGWVEVPDRPFEPQEEHALGPHPEGGRTRWKPATAQWYDVISRMPHCILWAPEHWQFARSTALVYDRWIRGDNSRAGELRQREAKLGTTWDARRDLRIRYVNPKAGHLVTNDDETEEANTTAVTDFAAAQRRRLLDAP